MRLTLLVCSRGRVICGFDSIGAVTCVPHPIRPVCFHETFFLIVALKSAEVRVSKHRGSEAYPFTRRSPPMKLNAKYVVFSLIVVASVYVRTPSVSRERAAQVQRPRFICPGGPCCNNSWWFPILKSPSEVRRSTNSHETIFRAHFV
jgi:hypothetical protein